MPETGFINKTMSVGAKTRRYVVYVPHEYDATKAWPLIVFLHGAGERGDDGLMPTEVGLGSAIRRHVERFPCVVVMPQCPDGMYWDKAFRDIDEAIARTEIEYAIDPARVYLTGISMGGYATWIYGAAQADRFAALLPICGGGKIEDAPALATLPIWAFHGDKDETVLPEESRKMVHAVKKAGGKAWYTEYHDIGHNSWDKAYNDPKAIKWLLKQRKR